MLKNTILQKRNPAKLKAIKNNQKSLLNFSPGTCIVLTVGLLIITSCKKHDNDSLDNKNNSNSDCKDTPARIEYGMSAFDVNYNSQGKPTQITNYKMAFNLDGTELPPTEKTAYVIEYNPQGQATKLSRSTNAKLEHYYLFEYNAKRQITKQTDYDSQGQSNTYSTADYDNNGSLIKTTTLTQGNSIEATSDYEYANGNLIKKIVKNIYNPDLKEYYDADFSYEYYLDKEVKLKTFFDGLLGVRFIADYVGSQSIYYLPDSSKPQLLFAQEASGGKNMLKNIHVVAHHYVSDDTEINFSYEYDNNGFPTLQKGLTERVITRSEPTPFGVPTNVTSTFNPTSTATINYKCSK